MQRSQGHREKPRARLPSPSPALPPALGSRQARDPPPAGSASARLSCGGERAAITHCGKNETLENTRRGIQGWDRAQAALCDTRAGRPTARALWGLQLPHAAWGQLGWGKGKQRCASLGAAPRCPAVLRRDPHFSLPATLSWPGRRAGRSSAGCPCPLGSRGAALPSIRRPHSPTEPLPLACTQAPAQCPGRRKSQEGPGCCIGRERGQGGILHQR